MVGGKAIATPGAVKAYKVLHERYGVLPWAELFTESIDLARNGYVVTDYLALNIQVKESEIKNLTNNLGIYLNGDGSLKKSGQIAKNPELAESLQKIADDADAFYKGQLAKDIIADIADYRSGLFFAFTKTRPFLFGFFRFVFFAEIVKKKW